MRITRIMATVLIGSLLLAACGTPAPTIPMPEPTTLPTPPTPPATPPTTPPTTPPPTPPTTPPVTPTPPPTTPPAVRGPYEVWAAGRAFVPQVLTVPVGTTVTWTNKDGIEHTVTSNDGLFAESITFQSFTYTFTERGTFRYSCEPHPDMIGTVVVE